MSELAIQWIAAFFAAVLGAMGMGGGGVLLLYLTLLAGVPQMSAQGINLLFFLPVGGVALLLHWKNGLVRWRSALPAILLGLLGAAGGSWVASRLGDALLRRGFGLFLLFIGGRELLAKKQPKKDGISRSNSRHKTPRPRAN